jgi:hypothetical protein
MSSILQPTRYLLRLSLQRFLTNLVTLSSPVSLASFPEPIFNILPIFFEFYPVNFHWKDLTKKKLHEKLRSYVRTWPTYVHLHVDVVVRTWPMYVDVGVEKVVGSIFNVTKCLNHDEEFHSINGQALILIFYKTFRPPQKKVFFYAHLWHGVALEVFQLPTCICTVCNHFYICHARKSWTWNIFKDWAQRPVLKSG